jgi:hypothetical protein
MCVLPVYAHMISSSLDYKLLELSLGPAVTSVSGLPADTWQGLMVHDK